MRQEVRGKGKAVGFGFPSRPEALMGFGCRRGMLEGGWEVKWCGKGRMVVGWVKFEFGRRALSCQDESMMKKEEVV